jgi:hypothetical protein
MVRIDDAPLGFDHVFDDLVVPGLAAALNVRHEIPPIRRSDAGAYAISARLPSLGRRRRPQNHAATGAAPGRRATTGPRATTAR